MDENEKIMCPWWFHFKRVILSRSWGQLPVLLTSSLLTSVFVLLLDKVGHHG